MIDVMYARRKDQFKEHPSIVEGLDLIQDDDQITHLLSLDDEIETEDTISELVPLVIHVQWNPSPILEPSSVLYREMSLS